MTWYNYFVYIFTGGFPAAAAAAYAAYGRGYSGYPGFGFPYPTGNLHPFCFPYPMEPLSLYNLHSMQL